MIAITLKKSFTNKPYPGSRVPEIVSGFSVVGFGTDSAHVIHFCQRFRVIPSVILVTAEGLR